jgi:hypothetical protein
VVLNATADISVKTTIRTVVSIKVVARVEASDPRLKNEYVIYSAHSPWQGPDARGRSDLQRRHRQRRRNRPAARDRTGRRRSPAQGTAIRYAHRSQIAAAAQAR